MVVPSHSCIPPSIHPAKNLRLRFFHPSLGNRRNVVIIRCRFWCAIELLVVPRTRVIVQKRSVAQRPYILHQTRLLVFVASFAHSPVMALDAITVTMPNLVRFSRMLAVTYVFGSTASCSSIAVGDIYTTEDAGPDAAPDARLINGPEAGADVATSTDAGGLDATVDAGDAACFAPGVSYPSNVFCGPQGPGAVCQVTGTIYICREPPGGPGQPALQGCVLVGRGVDKNTAELITRTVCPEAKWVRVPDPTQLCGAPALPNRYNGPSTGLVPSGCFRNGGWMIDGVIGSSACCTN